MFAAAFSASADTQSWATIDSTGAAPTLEAGQQFYTSMSKSGGSVEFTLSKNVKGIVVTCLPQAGGYDVGDCIALVKRDPSHKKFLVSPRPVVSQNNSAGSILYALGTGTAAARFTVIVYTD